jgi:hypothetical protein
VRLFKNCTLKVFNGDDAAYQLHFATLVYDSARTNRAESGERRIDHSCLMYCCRIKSCGQFTFLRQSKS